MDTTEQGALAGRSRRVRRALLTVLALAGTSVLVLVETSPEPSAAARTAVWALVWLACTVPVVVRALRAGPDQRLWRAVALFLVVVGAALVAHPALTGLGAAGVLPLLPVALAVLATSLVVYSAFLRWNLTRTHSGDPNDLLNAVSAVLTGQALLGLLVAHLVDSSLHLPWWQLQPVLAAGAAAVVITGTVVSTAVTAGGGRDRTAWLFVAGCAAALVGAGCLAAGTETGTQVPGTGVWLGLAAACVGLAAVRSRSVAVPLRNSGVSATVGAYGVLVLALVVVAADGLLAHAGAGADGDPWVLLAGGLGALGAATRLLLNITELSQLDATRREALTDELTGLANRRAVLRHLAALHAEGAPFALALLDLDGFKAVNDRFGHAAGDALLVQVGNRLRAVVPASRHHAAHALVGRLGGDEFAVVTPLPGRSGDPAAAAAWGGRVLSALGPAMDLGSTTAHVGCSAGVVVRRPGDQRPGEDPVADALRRADAAMYAAKRSGGGLRVHDGSTATATTAAEPVSEDRRGALDDEGPRQPELTGTLRAGAPPGT